MTKNTQITNINAPELQHLDFLRTLNQRFFTRDGELYYNSPNQRTQVRQRYVNVLGYRLAVSDIYNVLMNAKARGIIKTRKTPKKAKIILDYFIHDYEVYDRTTNQKTVVNSKMMAALERKCRPLNILVDRANNTFSVPKSHKDDVDGYIGIVTNDFEDTDTHYVMDYRQHYDAFTFYIAGRYLTPVVTQL